MKARMAKKWKSSIDRWLKLYRKRDAEWSETHEGNLAYAMKRLKMCGETHPFIKELEALPTAKNPKE